MLAKYKGTVVIQDKSVTTGFSSTLYSISISGWCKVHCGSFCLGPLVNRIAGYIRKKEHFIFFYPQGTFTPVETFCNNLRFGAGRKDSIYRTIITFNKTNRFIVLLCVGC